jgi:outer membrane protein OmpA-like peptidoglycan-associated protein
MSVKNYRLCIILIVLLCCTQLSGTPIYSVQGYIHSSPWFYEPIYEMNCISFSTVWILGIDLGRISLGLAFLSDYVSFQGEKEGETLKGAWFNAGSTFEFTLAILPRLDLVIGAGGVWNQESANFNDFGWLSNGRPGIEITAAPLFTVSEFLELAITNRLDLFFPGEDEGINTQYFTGLRAYIHPGPAWLRLYSEVNAFYWSYNSEILPQEFSSWVFQARVGAAVTFNHLFQKKEDSDTNRIIISEETDSKDTLETDQEEDRDEIIIPDETDGSDESENGREQEKDDIITSDPDLLKLKNAQPGDEIKFYTIQFTNEALTPASIPLIEGMAGILRDNESLVISITGYSEFLMDPRKELELSKTRAAVIKEFLMTQGVKEEHIRLNPIGNIMMPEEKTYIGITVIRAR